MKKLVYIVLIVMSIGVAALAQESHQVIQPLNTGVSPALNPNAPEITFNETIHDFGRLKKGIPVTCKFIYKNTGKEPLVLHDCKSVCDCISSKYAKEPVEPGNTGFIEIQYDSMHTGVFNKEVLVASNAKTPNLFLLIKGVVEDAGGE